MGSSNDNGSRPRRVMVIGFDGATLELIEPWAAAGILPAFKRLMERGAWGPLQSTMPPVTPAAWSSLATGTQQGKHGLFDFYARRPGSYETNVVNAANRHGATLWGLLGEAGYRTTVFNVPASYPPDRVNGVMISGLLTPTQATDAAWPPEVLQELKQAVPGFSFYPPGIFSEGQEAAFVQQVLDWDKMTLQATEFLMTRQPWDFLFTVFIGVDIMSHFMWRHMVTRGASAPTDDPATRETLANAIQAVYRQADAILSTLLEMAGDDTYVAVVSDHGFGPLDYYMHVNAWLVERGYLKFKRTPAVMLKYLAYRLGVTPLFILNLMRRLRLGGKVQETVSTRNDWAKAMVKKAFLSLADIDWSRTTIYATGYGAGLFVNLKGREPQGIVEPGAQCEALLQRLTADLRELRHPETKEPLVGEVYRRSDLYSGPYAELAPDLMFVPRDWRNQPYGVHDFASSRWLEPTPDRTGTHRMNGILFLTGPGILPGARVEGASLWDLAPTILALMKTPIPKNMDGQVLSAALAEELRSQLTVTYRDVAEESQQAGAAPVLGEDEEQVIRDRLEALGYFG